MKARAPKQGVMAGLVPAIHVLNLAARLRRGCPAHRCENTPSFGRLWPGTTNENAEFATHSAHPREGGDPELNARTIRMAPGFPLEPAPAKAGAGMSGRVQTLREMRPIYFAGAAAGLNGLLKAVALPQALGGVCVHDWVHT